MSLIPRFPSSTVLDIDSLAEVKANSVDIGFSCDYSAGNLYAWYGQEYAEVSKLGQFYIINSKENRGFLLIGDPANTRSLMYAIQKLFSIYPTSQIYNLCLNDSQVVVLKRSGVWKLVANRNEYDYIYSTARLARMEGGEFAKKRLKTNLFLRLYGDKYSTEFYEGLPKRTNDVMNLINTWTDYDPTPGRIAASLKEKKRLYKLIEDDRLSSICTFYTLELRIQEKLVGFMIFELVNSQLANAYFTKVNLNISGVSDFIMRTAGHFLEEKGIKYLNNEEDMGIIGLRESKTSFRPELLLAKYTIKADSKSRNQRLPKYTVQQKPKKALVVYK